MSAGGRPAVIGLGPGSPDQLTRAAAAELAAAEVLMGYRGYLDLLPVGLAPGRRQAFGLGEERRRPRRAAAGARVALVSSGDLGIYGMAALAVDEAVAVGEAGPDLTVLPGVTAARAAGALLGAPLGVDFACLSLPDLLVPRAELLERVEALAAVDIVLALYNPASRGRSEPWQAAIASLRRHRAAGTPVAGVRRAWRDGQEVRLSDVEHLDALPVDMETVVVIGSRRTRGHGRWLYTLRDEGVRTVGT